MAPRATWTDATRDLVTAGLALLLLIGAAIAAWSLLAGGGLSGEAADTVGAVRSDVGGGTAAEPVADRESDQGDEDEAELRISIHTPTALAVDGARAVLIDVTNPEGQPLPGDTPLVVHAVVEPTAAFRGYLAVLPSLATTTAGDLRMSKVEVAVAGGAECDQPAGTLRVHVMELAGEGRQAVREVDLPEVACSPDLPEPTEALHLVDPVCGKQDLRAGDHAEELRAMMDGEDQRSYWCMSSAEARELGLIAQRRSTPPTRSVVEDDDRDDRDDDRDDRSGDDRDDNGDDDRNGNDGGNGNGNGDTGDDRDDARDGDDRDDDNGDEDAVSSSSVDEDEDEDDEHDEDDD